MRMKSVLMTAMLCLAGPANAADFSFFFTTDVTDPDITSRNGVPGSVSGRILGLAEDGVSSAAQVFIDSFTPNPAAGLPTDAAAWSNQYVNSFTVSGGMIVDAFFEADQNLSGVFDRLYIGAPLSYSRGDTNYASVGVENRVAVWNNLGQSSVIFTRLDVDDAVPEPATWAMMISGFGLIGSAMRRRKVAVAYG